MSRETRVQDKALIDVALELFGLRGLEGVGTRAIAQAAGRPMSTITYQFGGKEGLYLACAQHISEAIGGLIGGVTDAPPADTPAGARTQLAEMFAVLTRAMLLEHTSVFAQFIMREQQAPSAAFDIIFDGTIGPFLERVVALLGVIAGEKSDPAAHRVRAITLMGQVAAFRVAQAAVLRLNRWEAIGPAQVSLADVVIQQNLHAILDAVEEGKAS